MSILNGWVPVIFMAIFSYKQGKKGYNEAIRSRDNAMANLDNVMDKLMQFDNWQIRMEKELKSAPGHKKDFDSIIKTLDGFNEHLEEIYRKLEQNPKKEELLDSIQKSVQGSWGRMVRSTKENIDKEMKEGAQEILDNMTEEEKMEHMQKKVQSGIWDWVMSLIPEPGKK